MHHIKTLEKLHTPDRAAEILSSNPYTTMTMTMTTTTTTNVEEGKCCRRRSRKLKKAYVTAKLYTATK